MLVRMINFGMCCISLVLRTKLYFGKEVEYGKQKGIKIGKTKICVMPSTAGSANAFWNIRYWREARDLIKK